MPFGAEAIAPAEMPTMMDVIGDLEDLDMSWDPQPYRKAPSKFVEHLRNESGVVDGHINKTNLEGQRIKEIFDILGNDGWKPMTPVSKALREAVAKNNDQFPQAWLAQEEKLRASDFNMGFTMPCRWDGNSWAHVMTGGALDHVIHPTLERRITHREAARLQGLPDDWEFAAAKDYSPLSATWGKAVAVQAAEWIADAAKASLEGQPNGPQGELIGDREWLVNTDKGFSRQAVKKKYYTKES
jgi:site-specific DNA-cytosine methylase